MSIWMKEEMAAEVERSLERESDRLASIELSRVGSGRSLDRDEVAGLLDELYVRDDIAAMVADDYVSAVGREVSRRLGADIDLRLERWADGVAVASFDAAAAPAFQRYANADLPVGRSKTLVLDERKAKIRLERLIELLLDRDGVQMRVLDDLASSTDALCADRFIDFVKFESDASSLRSGSER